MNTKELLTELNLTDREATLYLALLETGQGTPTTLSQKTELKRPTVYLDLESLRRKKLVGLSLHGKRTIYVPETPGHLRSRIEEQKKALDQVLPLLTAMERKGGTKPHVRYYDDRKHIYDVWKKEVWTYSENRYITHFDLLAKAFPQLPDEYERLVRSGAIHHVQELYSGTLENIAYARSYTAKNHEIRIIPKGLDFALDISIWEGGVALFSAQDMYMLVISGEAIVKSFMTLFQALWLSAKKLEEFSPSKKR